ncbi:stimulated by retinoic acid gene 6 protein-like isoform X3 [Salmo trutta]|uniref:stimulated by retinoic acid gene 6 protein-like isoform X3 n=1 Tax=Salmo trutta TaxID=8032 RepID=UPI0011329996|nr:stimulated by retinoic acid gene 6 protein-like isoform X3 [Salmo trutta]
MTYVQEDADRCIPFWEREHELTKGTPNQPCDSGVSMDLFLHYSLILSFVIVVVLSALQRRSRHLPIDEKLPFLNNRFGIVVLIITLWDTVTCPTGKVDDFG